MPAIPNEGAKRNRLLAALSVNEYARLQDDLEMVSLKLGESLYNLGANLMYAYFPITCIVSLISTTQNGATAELALIGNDGLVGIPLVLGGKLATHRTVVQSAGAACRIRADVLLWELEQAGNLRRNALRYVQCLMTQMAQSVLCNRHHTVDQQLCRWLLMSFDRLPGSQLKMTQALIADMLGVRREAVTAAAVKLQSAGLIRYSRGLIELTDRSGLEARVCECYGVLKAAEPREYEAAQNDRDDDPGRTRARPNPATLRQRAEKRLRQARSPENKKPQDAGRRMHELEVHQIELEMHNMELNQAYDEADTLRRRYAEIYDFAPVAYATVDALTTLLDINLAGARLLGIERIQKARHRFVSFLAPDCRQRFIQFIDTVLKASEKTSCEVILAENARRPAAHIKVEAIPNGSGNECRMVIIDQTVERHALLALKVREQYLRATIDNFPFLVWLKDEKSQFLTVNTPFAQNFEWPSAESLVGKSDFDIATRAMAMAYRADDQAVLQSGKQKTVEELIESAGQHRWYETYKSPVRLDGQIIGTVGFARDITERLTTRQALEESERRHRGFIEKLPLCVAITQDGEIRYLNPAGLALIGYSYDACVGKPFLPLLGESDRARVIDIHQRRARGEATPSEYEVSVIHKSGRLLDCRLYTRSIEFDGQIAALAIIEDITRQKALEKELRQLASTDSLTGLANRRYFFERMDEAWSRLKRGLDRRMAIVMLDLDHFKAINDQCGHAAGDLVLQRISGLLSNELRRVDVAGRIGGEEFAILLPGTDLAEAAVFAERLRRAIAEMSTVIDKQPIAITASMGIAAMHATDSSADQGLRRANKVLYAAKAAGRNRFEVIAPADQVQAKAIDDGVESQNLEKVRDNAQEKDCHHTAGNRDSGR